MKTAREEIFNRLKKTNNPVPQKPDFSSPVFNYTDGQPEEVFKNNLELVNGNFLLFHSENELFEQLSTEAGNFTSENIYCCEPSIQALLKKYRIGFSDSSDFADTIEAGITGCEFLIAQTGSVMVSSAQKGGRQLFAYAPVHVVIAQIKQVVNDLQAAYEGIANKYGKNLPSQITLITGPSRTADIEKTLTLGAHGPKELHVFLY